MILSCLLCWLDVVVASNDCDDDAFNSFQRAVSEAQVPLDFCEIVEEHRCTSPIKQTRTYRHLESHALKKWSVLHNKHEVRTAFIDVDE